jgi:tRNA uridine 5-carboxymethylaminomethyl modification enzyme
VLGAELPRDVAAFELLRRPGVDYAALVELTGPAPFAAPGAIDDRLPGQIAGQVEVRAKYAGYIQRQEAEIERVRHHELSALPPDMDYGALAGLSEEVRQKLSQVRPATIGQAGRIPGVTPAAVQILVVHLKSRGRKSRAQVA